MDIKAKIKQAWPAILILVLAAASRLTLLGIKPPHFDEGVNGWFVDQMTRTGFYHYDPTNYHGPFHFYILFLFQTLLGRHIWALRLPLALVSLACVAFAICFDRFIGTPLPLGAHSRLKGASTDSPPGLREQVTGRAAALWAAAAMAVSPGCVFYGRYAIHEYWLVLSLMLIAWGLIGMWTTGEKKYFWALWIGITGAVLTKETYIIHFGCLVLTFPCLWALEKLSPSSSADDAAPPQWTWRDLVVAFLLFAGAVVLFYSGTFMDMPGLKGVYKTFAAWAQTGKSGNGHEKAWYYWFKLLGRYEWPSAIGVLVALLTVLPRTPRFIRALAIYGCGALAAYSIIHYKTPWCIVSLTWPFLLLFGFGVEWAVRKFGSWVGSLAAALLLINLCDSIWLNFFHYTDAKEPYVYVQTFTDINKLMAPLNALVARNPANYQLTGHILVTSYHPLPWLLGDFPNIGYYDDNISPPGMDADFLLVEDTRIDDAESALRNDYFTAPLKLRDAQDELKLYLSAKKFGSLFPGRTPDFIAPKDIPDSSDTPAPPATSGTSAPSASPPAAQ